MILVGETEFPAEQHRLVIAIDEGRPGWVVSNMTPAIIPNTDTSHGFTQILSSARMGSAVFAPLIWSNQCLGVLVVASQARNTYREVDLSLLVQYANLASAVWVAKGGPTYLATLEPGVYFSC